MTKLRTAVTAFTAGELQPALRARSDTALYYVGCEKLTNAIVAPEGGAKTRPAIRNLINQVKRSKLMPFIFDENTKFAVMFDGTRFRFVNAVTDEKIDDVDVPEDDLGEWNIDDLSHTQALDVMLLAEPSKPLLEVSRVGAESFAVASFEFEAPPQYKYHPDRAVQLELSGTTGQVTVDAVGGSNPAVFSNTSFGEIWMYKFSRFKIIDVDPTFARATVELLDDADGGEATDNWSQQAFNGSLGYPRTVLFHDGRLVIGGSKAFPFTVWMSRTGAPFDFQLTENPTASDPIQIDIQDANPIQHIVSGAGGIEIFSQGSESVIPSRIGDPVTPSNVSVKEQSKFGSRRRAAPIKLDAQTIFAQRSAGVLREFVFADLEQAYQAVPLTIRAAHLVDDPISMTAAPGAFGTQADNVIVVNSDGTGAILTSQRTEQVTAWSDLTMRYPIYDVLAVDEKIYVAYILPGDEYRLGVFDTTADLDAQVELSNETPTTSWSATIFADREIDVISDGYWRGKHQVAADGSFTVQDAATSLKIGHLFDFEIRPMSLQVQQGHLLGRPVRISRCDMTFLDSAGLILGKYRVGDRPIGQAPLQPPQPQSKTVRKRQAGWTKQGAALSVTRDGPFAQHILSLSFDVRVGG